MSGNQSVDGSHPTTSPKGTYTFAATSDVDVEGHRCAEDRNFMCPIGRKISCRRADFVVHYRTHTGKMVGLVVWGLMAQEPFLAKLRPY
ncbi:hypothetical protein AVEN_158417-1, partial [Araneus ventricosus]